MVLADFLFMHRMATVTNIKVITGETNDEEDGERISAEFYKKFKVERGASFAFTPHITIAWKDLTPQMFTPAMEDFKKRIYRRKWTCENISLIVRKQSGWEIAERFNIGGGSNELTLDF